MGGTTTNGFSKSHAQSFANSPSNRSTVTGAFGHDININQSNADVVEARQKNMLAIKNSSVKMKFPENSPYNANNRDLKFKPNQNRKEMILNAKKADFQGYLLNSSVKFTMDQRNNKMSYNNSAGGGGEKDMIYNLKSRKPDRPWAEQEDKASKNHLTQM